MSATNSTNLEEIRAELKTDVEAYIESNRKRTESYLSLAMDMESMYEYAQFIHETDEETAESISQLITNLLSRWKEMTLIATDGRFEEAFSIYQYIRLEVDLAREGHMRKHLQTTDPADTYHNPNTSESDQTLVAEDDFTESVELMSPDASEQHDVIQFVDETFFDFLRDDVTLELNQLSLTLGKIIANKGEESDWKNLRLLCDSIKESSIVFGFEATIDIAETAWQIAYAADQYTEQRTVEVAQGVAEAVQRYAELIELAFEVVEPGSKAENTESLLHRVSIRTKPVAAGLARKAAKPKLKVAQTIAKQTETEQADISETQMASTSNKQQLSDIDSPPQLRLVLEETSLNEITLGAAHPVAKDIEEPIITNQEIVLPGTHQTSVAEPETARTNETILPIEEKTMDQELRDLFRDEAAGYLSELSVELRCLRNSPQELPLWEIVRRLTHTIKGSAAMVGMHDVSDEAWTAEQLAHTAIKETAQRSASRVDRVIRLASGIAKLLAVPFHVPNPDPPVEAPKPAVAALPRSTIHTKSYEAAPAKPAPAKAPTPQPIQSKAHLQVPVYTPPPKEPPPIAPTIDPELQNIFREEVSAFLKDLSLELARLRRSEQDADIWEIVKRLCNTIKGSALMIGLEDISDEAWSAEQLAQTAIKEASQRTTSRADRIVRITTGIAKRFGITFVVASPSSQNPA